MKLSTVCKQAVFSTAILLGVSLCAQAAKKAPAEWGQKIQWQQAGKVVTLPALQNANRLSDGKTKTNVIQTKGGEAGTEMTITFDQPLNVTMFRYTQRGNSATHYQLLADTEGKGTFKVIQDRKDPKPIKEEWIELPVNQKVYALRYVALEGQIGYRDVFPYFSEIEIYSKDRAKIKPLTSLNGPRVETLPEIPEPVLDKKNVDIRICTDWWNYGMGSWDKVRDKVPFDQWGGFKSVVAQLKELDANSVRMFAESEGGGNGWMSFETNIEKDPKYVKDYMRPLTAAMKKEGFPVYYFSHAWKPPFQKRGQMAPSPWCRWDYPYHQSDTLVGVNDNYKVTYPCVLCDDDYRLKWTDMMRGALKAGATGVYLMPDEYFFKGHNLARVNCPSCTREFKKAYGYDSLPKLALPKAATNSAGQVNAPLPEDSEHYRKWKLFEYEKLAELFERIAKDLKKEFPKAIIVATDNQGSVTSSNGRLEHTVCNDIIGKSTVYDAKQVYGSQLTNKEVFGITYTKQFIAAAGKERLLSSAGWGGGDTIRPAYTYNPILQQVFLGAKALEVYRLNYMYMAGGVSVYKKLFHMVRLLEKWGIHEGEIPETVGVVYSRASEDWYYVKVTALMNPDKKSKATDFNLNLADETINKIVASGESDERQRILSLERTRGFGANLTMESLLACAGIPYSIAIAERPDNMKNLKRFKALVVPFAYSLSKSAFEEIKAAADAGTKVFIFDQLAPTNEYGTPYEKPLLLALEGHKNVTFIKESLADASADLARLDGYKKMIEAATADAGYAFNSNGQPVAYLVSKQKDGFLLYLCNYNERDLSGSTWAPVASARVGISLPVEEGATYRMETFNSDAMQLNKNALKGKELIPAADLKKFMIELNPQEVKLVRIYKAAK